MFSLISKIKNVLVIRNPLKRRANVQIRLIFFYKKTHKPLSFIHELKPLR